MKYSFENTPEEQNKLIDLIGTIFTAAVAIAQESITRDTAESHARTAEAQARRADAELELARMDQARKGF